MGKNSKQSFTKQYQTKDTFMKKREQTYQLGSLLLTLVTIVFHAFSKGLTHGIQWAHGIHSAIVVWKIWKLEALACYQVLAIGYDIFRCAVVNVIVFSAQTCVLEPLHFCQVLLVFVLRFLLLTKLKNKLSTRKLVFLQGHFKRQAAYMVSIVEHNNDGSTTTIVAHYTPKHALSSNNSNSSSNNNNNLNSRSSKATTPTHYYVFGAAYFILGVMSITPWRYFKRPTWLRKFIEHNIVPFRSLMQVCFGAFTVRIGLEFFSTPTQATK